MLTISKALNASQAATYHAKEFTSAEQNYWKQGETIVGEWQGRLATRFGLSGDVDGRQFELLSQGQHPQTEQQLVKHRKSSEYSGEHERTVKSAEHRAGWDATFSAPKSVSLTALVGGDDRVRAAHREAVTAALTELEKYTQARLGGNKPAETTGRFLIAKFEHDTARPVDGYAAPQLHTHVVVFNMTERSNRSIRALQERALFDSQQFATAVYQAELMYRLKGLGYEIQPGRSGAPEIKGYTQEYLDVSSPRRQQIEEALARSGRSGPEAAQIAAHNTRDKKQVMKHEKVLAAHQQIAAEHGNQAAKVVEAARSREAQISLEPREDRWKLAREAVSYSKGRNFEREAVTDERLLMRDALRRGMGDVTYHDVRINFEKRREAGEFVAVAGPRYHTGERFTTREVIASEQANIDHVRRSQNTVEPILSPREAARFAETQGHLNPVQRQAVLEILSGEDRIQGLQGYAGSGKTSTLTSIREAAEANGFVVLGFAPTNRAAEQLREAGVPAETLQMFLTRGAGEQVPGLQSRNLHLLDESSLASTRQMNAFLDRLNSNDRVLLIGDVRQHQGVDAGMPFEQLQANGLKTAVLEQIIRQKDPELLRTVENLSLGKTALAVESLMMQGRTIEAPNRQERLQKIADEFAKSPDGTLAIAPDNATRQDLNVAIRNELRDKDQITGRDQALAILVPRADLANEDRKWAAQYGIGDLVFYSRGSKEYSISPHSYATVLGVAAKENLVTVRTHDEKSVTYDPKRLSGITAYRQEERSFAVGERIQFTANDRQVGVVNRQLGTISSISPEQLTVRMDADRREVRFDPRSMRHFDYGYAVTSHSSQGLTSDRVLINVDSSAHRDLLNQRFAYVAVSRAANEVQLFTDDASRLIQRLTHEVSKSTAVELPPSRLSEASKQLSDQQPMREVAIRGIGLSL